MVAPSSTRAAPRAASVWPSEAIDALADAGRSDALNHPPVRGRLMQRIRNRAQFQAVLAGPPVAKTAHFALHRGALDGAHEGRPLFATADQAWLGVLLPKRWARRAVTRNAIRRQIYETARTLPAGLPPAAWVVRLRSEFSRKQFVSATSEPLKRAVRAELQQLLGKVSKAPTAPAPAVEIRHAG